MTGSDSSSSNSRSGSRHTLKDFFLGGGIKEAIKNDSSSTSSSHRHLLKKRNSRSTISPQSSPSSRCSSRKKTDEKVARDNSSLRNDVDGVASPHLSTKSSKMSSSDSSSPISESKGNERGSGMGSKSGKHMKGSDILGVHHRHNSHSHLSLKRFLKKFKPNGDSHHPVKTKHKHHYSILPKHSSSELFVKYGPVGRLLGKGASGSVNLVSLKDDPNAIFAVKKFRSKLPHETDNDYKQKVKNEFKVGKILHHENLIHTVELIKDRDSSFLTNTEYYIIMEYCPFDFFNLVMSGLMTTEEINCYFKQIVSGVLYLHSNNLAHRDLKLDNCVVNDDGILKLIDFGSAVPFRRDTPIKAPDMAEEERWLIRARGIVGSDPYLAPEVFTPSNFGYDPRAADVWSLGIMYCCMVLRRFPWKFAKASDSSFRSYAGLKELDDEEKLAETMRDGLHISDKDEEPVIAPGAHKLLRLLPENCRDTISKVLSIPPSSRLKMTQLINEDFFVSIDYCHYVDHLGRENKDCYKASNHKHHLITEEELQELQREKERQKKLKESGVV
ncbi:Piso0_003400 [Millerozyma farinosa CBS 7064]|uniref:non-specific serine/threonine protein kinase n=1 Tax=Pichia sorbitophila (strain ATCC MYA-4447 / BCRC 22081 / CBS 7064 / NBRC 10061 / NRRL Y-12695) TaxID=559304 RepID=G8YI00_PICSO|nr:Piso0_003400 [Millerozyma farinosa CBS 7064]CCE81052.1 Piso0_003400 [Millerozyma farinosa CBS 7064]